MIEKLYKLFSNSYFNFEMKSETVVSEMVMISKISEISKSMWSEQNHVDMGSKQKNVRILT